MDYHCFKESWWPIKSSGNNWRQLSGSRWYSGKCDHKQIQRYQGQKRVKTLGTYSVTKDAEIKKIKLVLKTGDQIAILAADDDSILIVKNGDEDNPYFVSADFLMGCSDYRGK